MELQRLRQFLVQCIETNVAIMKLIEVRATISPFHSPLPRTHLQEHNPPVKKAVMTFLLSKISHISNTVMSGTNFYLSFPPSQRNAKEKNSFGMAFFESSLLYRKHYLIKEKIQFQFLVMYALCT